MILISCKKRLERLKLTDKTSQDEEEANVQKTEESVRITRADVFGLPITDIPMKDFTPVELKYGDCVIHNQFSVHYSNENSTTKPRIAITCIIKLNKK